MQRWDDMVHSRVSVMRAGFAAGLTLLFLSGLNIGQHWSVMSCENGAIQLRNPWGIM